MLREMTVTVKIEIYADTDNNMELGVEELNEAETPPSVKSTSCSPAVWSIRNSSTHATRRCQRFLIVWCRKWQVRIECRYSKSMRNEGFSNDLICLKID